MSYSGKTPTFTQIKTDDVVILGNETVYFGDPTTNGSYRITMDGGSTLKIEVRVGGVWETRDEIA